MGITGESEKCGGIVMEQRNKPMVAPHAEFVSRLLYLPRGDFQIGKIGRAEEISKKPHSGSGRKQAAVLLYCEGRQSGGIRIYCDRRRTDL